LWNTGAYSGSGGDRRRRATLASVPHLEARRCARGPPGGLQKRTGTACGAGGAGGSLQMLPLPLLVLLVLPLLLCWRPPCPCCTVGIQRAHACWTPVAVAVACSDAAATCRALRQRHTHVIHSGILPAACLAAAAPPALAAAALPQVVLLGRGGGQQQHKHQPQRCTAAHDSNDSSSSNKQQRWQPRQQQQQATTAATMTAAATSNNGSSSKTIRSCSTAGLRKTRAGDSSSAAETSRQKHAGNRN